MSSIAANSVRIDSTLINKQATPAPKATEAKKEKSSVTLDSFSFDSKRMKTSVIEGMKFEGKMYTGLGAGAGLLMGAVPAMFVLGSTGSAGAAAVTLGTTTLTGAAIGLGAGAVAGAVDGAVVGLSENKTAARVSGAVTGGAIAIIQSVKSGKTSVGAIATSAVIGGAVGQWVGGKIFDKAQAKLAQ